MQQVIEKFLANGFADFAGLTVSGTVPIKQELLNELLGAWLSSQAAPSAPQASTKSQAPGAIDPRAVLKLIKKMEIRAETGVLTLEFLLRV